MIEVSGVTRHYGDFAAVKNISFSVNEGEILGMLGPNGAGKTTTIRMITGFLPPSRGRVVVAGHDLLHNPVEARRQIGYLPENVALYTEMRVFEYLTYRARLEGLSRSTTKLILGQTLERCLLEDVRNQVIGTLSKGYRQRVGIAAAILHEPKVLVLDEPTIGLDPKQIIAIRELIRDLGRRHTLLLSTHILPEVELLCDRVQIIDQGQIIAEGTPQSLSDQWLGNTMVRVGLKDPADGAAHALAQVEGVLSVSAGTDGDTASFSLECEKSRDPREEIFRLAVARGWVLLELSKVQASLEEVFVRLTTQERSGEVEAETGSQETARGREAAS